MGLGHSGCEDVLGERRAEEGEERTATKEKQRKENFRIEFSWHPGRLFGIAPSTKSVSHHPLSAAGNPFRGMDSDRFWSTGAKGGRVGARGSAEKQKALFGVRIANAQRACGPGHPLETTMGSG